MHDKKPREIGRHIRTLERRRDFLAQRLHEPHGAQEEAFDRAEFNALGYALQLMEEEQTRQYDENKKLKEQ